MGSWRCSCGELISPSFTECWNCGMVRLPEGALVRPDSMAVAVPREPMPFGEPSVTATEGKEEPQAGPASPPRGLWVEVLVVLVLYYLPLIFNAVFGSAQPEPMFVLDSGFTIVYAVQVIAPLLYLMARSGTPWKVFGLVRPTLVADVSLAVLVLILDFGAA